MKPSRALMMTVCLFFAFSIPAAASHSIESTFATDGIIIDGNTNDWGDRPVIYLEDSLRVVGVSHDQDNLYIMYRFGDARVAEQLLRRGVVLWINGDGKKKNKNDAFGVRYAGSEEIEASLEATRTAGEETSERYQNPRSGMAPPEGMAPMGPKVGSFTVIRHGIKDTIEGAESRFQAASTVIDGVYAYELRIPLDEIGGKVAATPATKQRKLAVGIQLGGLTEAEKELAESRTSEMREQRGGMSGGMGGRGGGMGGGMRPDGSGGGRPTLDPEINWLVVELPPTAK